MGTAALLTVLSAVVAAEYGIIRRLYSGGDAEGVIDAVSCPWAAQFRRRQEKLLEVQAKLAHLGFRVHGHLALSEQGLVAREVGVAEQDRVLARDRTARDYLIVFCSQVERYERQRGKNQSMKTGRPRR